MKNAKIYREFKELVARRLDTHLKKIILFGSRARGDFKKNSDYDILLIVDKEDKSIKDIVLDACVEMMDKYYALIGCVICDEKEWERKKRFPIGLNILKEGVEL